MSRGPRDEAAHNEVAQLRAMLAERERLLADLEAERAILLEEARRLAGSRSWRTAHRMARVLRAMTLRRTQRDSALDRMVRQLDRPQLPRVVRPAASTPAAGGVAAPGAAAPPRALDQAREAVARARADAEDEAAARMAFERDAAALAAAVGPEVGLGADGLAEPWPVDRRSLLEPAARPGVPNRPTVDVVVSVHNALDDARRCLWYLLARSGRPFRLILVDDGSEPATARFLEWFADRHPAVTLVSHAERRGYTAAANAALRESSADWVVLVNSDSVVSFGWLERLLACGESDGRIGVVGPLSNAASHQSVPAVRDGGDWATNPPPSWLGPDGMAFLVAALAPGARPRLPLVNGFCYAVRRAVLDTVGEFDEATFPEGYGEENDYTLRAADAGFEAAIADDVYVFHAKSRSFTPKGRRAAAPEANRRFVEKHGRRRVEELVARAEADATLAGLRVELAASTESEDAFVARFRDLCADPFEVVYVLAGVAKGGSGGTHSVYQEARALRALGMPARLALPQAAERTALDVYPDAEELIVGFSDASDLVRRTPDARVLVATYFSSVPVVADACAGRPEVLPAYYVQDYEPLLFERGSEAAEPAAASYGAIPGCVHYAKTFWLCNAVSHNHGVGVAKVPPSIDERTFYPRVDRPVDGPLRVAAMVRPRTARRQPRATLAVVEALQQAYPDAVAVTTFGCSHEELAALADGGPLHSSHVGVLDRAAVAELLSRVDVFVDLSIYQAFGRTALEAMACGAAAVVPAAGGAAEFAIDGVNALVVDSGDHDAVLAALGRLVEDRATVQALQANARETGSGYSSLRAALAQYLLFDWELRRRR